MFYGAGAGGAPTASAVLGDLVAVARNRDRRHARAGRVAYAELPVSPMGETVTRYHISLDVADKAGVLAQVADGVRRARRVHRDRAPGGQGRGGASSSSSPTARPTPRSRRPSRRCASSTPSARWRASCGSKGGVSLRGRTRPDR